jgi:hypothetical protein
MILSTFFIETDGLFAGLDGSAMFLGLSKFFFANNGKVVIEDIAEIVGSLCIVGSDSTKCCPIKTHLNRV